MLHIHACCKHMFLGVSYVCFQVFHLDVAYIFNSFQIFLGIFASVPDACVKHFIYLFCMLQLLHLDILKVDRVLHMGCVGSD
jgi:hypothetical protein